MDFWQQTLAGFTAMSVWEYLAVAFSVAYLLLAIKESLWCWLCAFLSTLIYTLLFYQGQLLMESALNVYYMVMAGYGYYAWRYGKNNHTLPITSWSVVRHSQWILATSIISALIGFLLTEYTHAQYAFLDSFTTCFAVMATFMLARKVLENWLYWIVIDAASMYLFFAKGYYPTLILFVFYTVMAAYGFKTWYDEHQNQRATAEG